MVQLQQTSGTQFSVSAATTMLKQMQLQQQTTQPLTPQTHTTTFISSTPSSTTAAVVASPPTSPTLAVRSFHEISPPPMVTSSSDIKPATTPTANHLQQQQQSGLRSGGIETGTPFLSKDCNHPDTGKIHVCIFIYEFSYIGFMFY